MDTFDRIASGAEVLLYDRGFAGWASTIFATQPGCRCGPCTVTPATASGSSSPRSSIASGGGGLDTDRPDGPGPEPVLHLVDRLGGWMATHAPRGCLFLGGLADHPDEPRITDVVQRSKRADRETVAARLRVAGRADDEAAVDIVVLTLEGIVATAPSIGVERATAGGRRVVVAALA